MLLDDLDWAVATHDEWTRTARVGKYTIFEHEGSRYNFFTCTFDDAPEWENLDKLTAQCVLNHLLDTK
jgi:hypothetical protein